MPSTQPKENSPQAHTFNLSYLKDDCTSALHEWTGPAGLLDQTAVTHSGPVSRRPSGKRSHYPGDENEKTRQN